MRKIKDNGRTLVLKRSKKGCEKRFCADHFCKEQYGEKFCTKLWGVLAWRETIPSRISRFIKRMVKRWN